MSVEHETIAPIAPMGYFAKPEQMEVVITGYFGNVDFYKNLIVIVDDAEKLKKNIDYVTRNLEDKGTSPLKDKYLRVKLDDWDKTDHRFSRLKSLIKKKVKLTVILKSYDFFKDGKDLSGCSCKYVKMTEEKKTAAEEADV